MAFEQKKSVADKISVYLNDRFLDFNDIIFDATKWFDPVFWETEKHMPSMILINGTNDFMIP